jgi:hypothetical protein
MDLDHQRPSLPDRAVIKSRNFFYDPGYQIASIRSVVIEVERPVGEIHTTSRQQLLGGSMKWALPRGGARGGAETMYPGYGR